jgi:hypothetical protein
MKTKISISRLVPAFVGTLLAVTLFSCDSSQQTRFVCNCEEQKQLQAFVKESIKPANNMSDEEMEDVINQLRQDGIRLYCKSKPVWLKHGGEIDWAKQKFDSCEVVMVVW